MSQADGGVWDDTPWDDAFDNSHKDRYSTSLIVVHKGDVGW